MVGSLYLGALRAAEEMARELGDDALRRHAAGRSSSAGSRHRWSGSSTASTSSRTSTSRSIPSASTATAAWPTSCSARVGPTRSAWATSIPRETVRQGARVRSGSTAGHRTSARRTNVHKPERWFAYPGRGRPVHLHLAEEPAPRPEIAPATATRSGPASSTRWPATWPGKGCSPRRWPSAAPSTSATIPPSTIRGTRSSAATTTPGPWPAGAC